jgi:hypothetical protein
VARVTSFVPPNFDLLLRSENGLVEFQVEVFAKIGSTLGPAAAPAPAASENIPEAKKVPENVPEVLENSGVKARRASTTSAHACVSEAVIERSFLTVRQNRVRLGDLLELVFRVGIVRIAVRMIGHRQLAVGALDLDIGSRTCNPEDFVVVAFAVVGQKLSCASRLVSN